MPYTCPKWECRHLIPFSSAAQNCPECGTYLFMDPPKEEKPVRALDKPQPEFPEAKKAKKAKNPERARVTVPLNDKEIEELLAEERRSWREPINDYYNDLSY